MQSLEIKSFENELATIRFCYLQAQFQEVAIRSEKLFNNTSIFQLFLNESPEILLTIVRIYVQALIELESLLINKEKIFSFVNLFSEQNKLSNSAALSFFKTFLMFNFQEIDAGEKLLAETFTKATDQNDFTTLCRCFHIQAVNYFYIKDQISPTLTSIDKALTLAENLKNEELVISCNLLKASALIQQNDLILAKDILLDSYQKSYQSGQHRLIAQILLRLYNVYKNLNDDQSAFLIGTLTLKSLNPNDHPRLYRNAQKTIKINSTRNSIPDLKIQITALKVEEKSKGTIEFKNQHILFDLLKLLSQHQGVRYSKEQLVEKVWGQEYKASHHDNLIYVSIKRLRTLIEPNVDNPIYILRDRSGYFIPTQFNIEFNDKLQSAKELNNQTQLVEKDHQQ